jgi:hypothetical protein
MVYKPTYHYTINTVDGRNPAPVDRWAKSHYIKGFNNKVMQDFATIHSMYNQ